jgi:hypothetical protein
MPPLTRQLGLDVNRIPILCRKVSTWERLKSSRRNTQQQSPEPAPKPKSSSNPGKKFVHEHDYTVSPTTYSYTTEQNSALFERFPLVNSKKLTRRTERPRQVRMLARDFMDDSLYNANYGYFSKEVEIFSPSAPFSYSHIANEDEFLYKWTHEFKEFSKRSNQQQQIDSGTTTARVSRQVWHTPTELFRPYYGQAIARYLLVNYKLSLYPYNDLVIYEMGAGNGTLMLDILDYIRDTQPDVYSRTRYNIIEISTNLASKQLNNLQKRAASAGHQHKVNIINKSIFSWNVEVPEPCFFIALEVFDNFAHDVIRYDNSTLQPYQGYVVVDAHGDFHEIYSPDLDSWANKFLALRDKCLDYAPAWELGYHPLAQPYLIRALKNTVVPFRGNLSDPEYIPTRYLEFLYILRNYFPEHRLLTSDFTYLKETIQGYNAPVVQTVMDKKMIPISTYMALQGFFDILFPTDFDLAAMLYRAVCGKLIKTASHRDFLEVWAELEATSTKTGENPLLSFYRNAAFMYS